MSVGLFDAVIRTFYRVCEFTDDPACVLRRAESGARSRVVVRWHASRNRRIGRDLAFWNQHLPRSKPGGPDSAGPA